MNIYAYVQIYLLNECTFFLIHDFVIIAYLVLLISFHFIFIINILIVSCCKPHGHQVFCFSVNVL